MCNTKFLSRKNCCAGHRTHQYERQRLARTPQRGLLRFPGARQEGIARSLSMHRHPPGLRFMPSCTLLRRAQKSMQRLAGLCSYYGPYCILWHHPQKSMQRLTGLCSHYGPYCILCILFGHFAKLFSIGNCSPSSPACGGHACVFFSLFISKKSMKSMQSMQYGP